MIEFLGDLCFLETTMNFVVFEASSNLHGQSGLRTASISTYSWT